jgi:hypothetical protein
VCLATAQLVVRLEPLTRFKNGRRSHFCSAEVSKSRPGRAGKCGEVTASVLPDSALHLYQKADPGSTLAVTSPHLPALPGLDFDTSRGKRSIHLDLRHPKAESSERTGRVRLEQDISVLDEGLELAPIGRRVAQVNGWGAVDLPAGHDAGEQEGNWGGPWRERKAFDSLVSRDEVA